MFDYVWRVVVRRLSALDDSQHLADSDNLYCCLIHASSKTFQALSPLHKCHSGSFWDCVNVKRLTQRHSKDVRF